MGRADVFGQAENGYLEVEVDEERYQNGVHKLQGQRKRRRWETDKE
jgi:hypothetical protein